MWHGEPPLSIPEYEYSIAILSAVHEVNSALLC